MGVEETLADGVWILVGIGVSVVSAMIPSPPSHRALHSTTSNSGKKDAEREGSGV